MKTLPRSLATLKNKKAILKSKKHKITKNKWLGAKFLTIIALFSILLGYSVWEHFPDGKEITTRWYGISQLPRPTIEDATKCIIAKEYKNINFTDEKEAEKFFKLLEENIQEFGEYVMVLNNATFPNGTFSDNLFPPKIATKLPCLKISFGNLAVLKGNTFGQFSSLEWLALENTKLNHFPKSALNKLTSLTYFSLTLNEDLRWIDYGLIENLSSLSTIQIQNFTCKTSNCTEESVHFFSNITGNKMAKKVQIVDYSYNEIPFFGSSIFSQFKNVISLYAMGSGIKEFEVGVFDNHSSIAQVELSRNHIAEIPENVFKNIFDKAQKICFDKNPLQCDCKMKWVQDYIKGGGQHPSIADLAKAPCSSPPRNRNVSLLNAEMCPFSESTTITQFITTEISSTTVNGSHNASTTTTTSTTTEKSTTTVNGSQDASTTKNIYTTTEAFSNPPDDSGSALNNNTVVMECPNGDIDLQSQVFLIRRSTKKLRLEKQHYFRISSHNETSITLEFDENRTDRIVFWVTDDGIADQTVRNCSCLTTPKMSFTLRNLTPERSYMFCVTDYISSSGNVLDCVPHTMAPLKENRPWLKEGEKTAAVVIITFVSILAFTIGAIIIYIAVLKNPVLIQKSNRVIVVKRKERTQVMIMPKGHEVLSHQKLPPMQDYDTSDTSSVVSYISAREPTSLEILSYKLERLRARSEETMTTFMEPSPPPYSEIVKKSRNDSNTSNSDIALDNHI